MSQRLGSKEKELSLCEENLERLKAESEALEKRYAETPAPQGEMGRNMVIKDYFAHIEMAFRWAKEQNVKELMQKIENLANAKLELLQGDGSGARCAYCTRTENGILNCMMEKRTWRVPQSLKRP